MLAARDRNLRAGAAGRVVGALVALASIAAPFLRANALSANGPVGEIGSGVSSVASGTGSSGTLEARLLDSVPGLRPNLLQFARARGRLGRSRGCPAVSKRLARPIIDAIKGGSLVFSYYADRVWLESSQLLRD